MPHLSRYREGITQGQREDRMLRALGMLSEQQLQQQQIDLRKQEQKAESAANQEFSTAMDVLMGIGEGGAQASGPTLPPDIATAGIPPQALQQMAGTQGPPPMGQGAAVLQADPLKQLDVNYFKGRRGITNRKAREKYDLEYKRVRAMAEKRLQDKAVADMIDRAHKQGKIDDDEKLMLATQATAGDYTGPRNFINERSNQLAVEAHASKQWETAAPTIQGLLDSWPDKRAAAEWGVKWELIRQDPQAQQEMLPHKFIAGIAGAMAERPTGREALQKFQIGGSGTDQLRMVNTGMPGLPAQAPTNGAPQGPPPSVKAGRAGMPDIPLPGTKKAPKGSEKKIKSIQDEIDKIKKSDLSPEERAKAIRKRAKELGLTEEELRAIVGQ